MTLWKKMNLDENEEPTELVLIRHVHGIKNSGEMYRVQSSNEEDHGNGKKSKAGDN